MLVGLLQACCYGFYFAVQLQPESGFRFEAEELRPCQFLRYSPGHRAEVQAVTVCVVGQGRGQGFLPERDCGEV